MGVETTDVELAIGAGDSLVGNSGNLHDASRSEARITNRNDRR
jgi:hypothetical protein